MNQRASHFNFGTVSQNYGSVYVKDYTLKKANGLSLGKTTVPVYESGTWCDKNAKFNPLTTNQR